jgi:hypothetical protein
MALVRASASQQDVAVYLNSAALTGLLRGELP